MQTQSHVIINAFLGKQLEKRGIRPMYWALTIGSFMPDIPLAILSIGYIALFQTFGHETAGEAASYAFDVLFFENPFWLASHNLFHAPLMILLYLAIGTYFGFRKTYRIGLWIFWFAIGNLLHSIIDILTHHSDGPLVFFPLNWDYRFPSPISYWEVEYYAIEFTIFEVSLFIILTIYWINQWRHYRKSKRVTKES